MYYVLVIKEDATDDFTVFRFREKEKAFRFWQEHKGSIVVKDVKFKIVEEA